MPTISQPRRTGVPKRLGEAVVINPLWRRLLEDAAARPAEIPANAASRGLCLPARPRSRPPSNPGKDPGPPRLSNIRAIDFEDTGRALELLRQAVKCGLMPNASEYSRLLWLAAIERARTVPAENPAGVFLFVVKGRKWDFLSDDHFDAANGRLKRFLYARPPDVVPFLVPRPDAQERDPGTPRAMLSKDAELVRILRRRLGGRASLFAALRCHAAWDRERFDAALAELDAAENQPASPAGNSRE